MILNALQKNWARVGVKNLLRQGSNHKTLDNQLNNLTVPSRNCFLNNDFESTTFTKPNLDKKS